MNRVDVAKTSSELAERKRLHDMHFQTGPSRFLFVSLLVAAGLMAGCDGTNDALAPYEGERPLILQRVTQSMTSDVQWLGGRVAAIGVNRGEQAALDETLVWIERADDNTIESHVTVGEGGDAGFVETLGGVPIDALDDGETYTIWLATAEAVAAGLDSAQVNEHTFVDTTITMRLQLTGRPKPRFEASISRDERLSGTQYVVSWEPQDLAFRQIAIRQASTGGFSDLVWHVVTPEEQEPAITSPVVLGEAPEGTQQIIEFSGFGASNYTLWMVTDEWEGAFSPAATGYYFYTIFASNFEQEEEEQPEEEEGETEE